MVLTYTMNLRGPWLNSKYFKEKERKKFPSKHSSWWRCLSSSFSEDILTTSSRRLDQDEYIHLSQSSSEDIFKTSSRRLDQDQYIRLGHTSSRHFQDVFKTSSKNVFKTSSRRLQNVFKTSAKTPSRHLQDVLQGCLQDVLKTYHQVKLIAQLKDLPRSHLWEIYG